MVTERKYFVKSGAATELRRAGEVRRKALVRTLKVFRKDATPKIAPFPGVSRHCEVHRPAAGTAVLFRLSLYSDKLQRTKTDQVQYCKYLLWAIHITIRAAPWQKEGWGPKGAPKNEHIEITSVFVGPKEPWGRLTLNFDENLQCKVYVKMWIMFMSIKRTINSNCVFICVFPFLRSSAESVSAIWLLCYKDCFNLQ